MPAVSTSRVSKIVGYSLTPGDFRLESPNLPIRIVVIGEANTANQATLNTTKKQQTSTRQVGEDYGYGSPLYHASQILRPDGQVGVGGIPTIFIPQEEPGGAAPNVQTITPAGTATGNATHTVVINGRRGWQGTFYNFNVETGDTTDDITAKIEDAINNVLAAPVLATSTDYETTLTTKWKGETANDLTITVDTNDSDVGITYTVASSSSGSGTPSITSALNQFGNEWNNIIVNCYGAQTDILDALEDFNGKPDKDNPTGRYAGIVMKPFVAVYGSTADDPSSVTDARKAELTNACAPAPASSNWPFEVAAAMVRDFAPIAQDTPHLDVSGQDLNSIIPPEDGDIGSMSSYENRDVIVKKGCSTVDLNAGSYEVQDFVTTYHPDGEVPPQWRYVRNLFIDFNIRYGYYLIEQANVIDHVIANDADTVNAVDVIKPKQFKALLFAYADELASRGLIVDPDFMKDSITVEISSSNPDRFNVFFRYKRSGYSRIISTEAEAGFNFGS